MLSLNPNYGIPRIRWHRKPQTQIIKNKKKNYYKEDGDNMNINLWIDSEREPEANGTKWKKIKTPQQLVNTVKNNLNIEKISVGDNLDFFNVEDIVQTLIVNNCQPHLITFHGIGECSQLIKELKNSGCNAKIKTVAYGVER